MKIGMLLETPFPPDLRVENEMQTLAGAGHEIILFCLRHDKLLQAGSLREDFAPGIQVQRKYLSKNIYNKFRTTIVRLPFYINFWLRFLKSEKHLDAIHVHDLPLARVGQKFAAELKIPFILDLHENYPAAIKIWGHTHSLAGRFLYSEKIWHKYEQKMVTAADAVIVVVDEARDRLVHEGAASEKIRVVSNTLNLSELKSAPVENPSDKSENLLLTYFGGLGVHRGLEIAIRAMPEILSQNPKVRLKIIGDGKDRPALEALAHKLNVTENTIFTGWQKVKHLGDALSLIQESDICLVPYLSTEHTETTIPHKLFQYMYLKKPVLASSCAPLKRIVTGTQSGLVFQAGDSHDFAEKVKMLSDINVRQRFGENGHRAVINKYNWETDSQNLIQVYQNLRKA